MRDEKDTKYTHADREDIYERLVKKPISSLSNPNQWARVSKKGMPTPEGKVYKDQELKKRLQK